MKRLLLTIVLLALALTTSASRVFAAANLNAGVLTVTGIAGDEEIQLQVGPVAGEVIVLKAPGVVDGTLFTGVHTINVANGPGSGDKVEIKGEVAGNLAITLDTDRGKDDMLLDLKALAGSVNINVNVIGITGEKNLNWLVDSEAQELGLALAANNLSGVDNLVLKVESDNPSARLAVNLTATTQVSDDNIEAFIKSAAAVVDLAVAVDAGNGYDKFKLELDQLTPAQVTADFNINLNHLDDSGEIILKGAKALPLARLRARGQLTEIRAADLRFTDSEIATYLQHTTGLAYSPADIAALTVRTEGWIAGVQLLGLLIQDNLRRQADTSPTQIISNFTGANRYVIDYLTDEVLDQQPAARQDFLLRTSILERLTAPLCDALLVADQPSQPSQVILEELEKQNLFLTPLDEQRQWYRYHRLFADLLQTRLHQEAGAAEVAALHLRAGAWFEQHGLIAEALHHALAASDLDRAVELVAAEAMPMIRRGAITTVQEWLNALPPTRVRSHPRLCIHQAWLLFYSHQPDELEFWTNAAESALQTPAFAQLPNRTALAEHISALRTSIAELRQENGTVVQLAEAALARLAEDELGARGTNLYFLGRALCNLGETSRGIAAYRTTVTIFQQVGVTLAAMGALSDVAIFLLQQGKLREARMTLEEALRWATTQDLLQVPATAQLQMVLGQIYYEQNELTAAAEQVQRSIQLAKYMLPLTATLAHLVHAQVQWALGNRDGAAVALQEAAHVVAQRVIVPPESTLLVTRRVRLWLLQEDWPAVERWIAQSGLQVDDKVVYDNEQALIALARALVTRGRVTNRSADLQRATALLTRLAGALRTAERAGHLLEVLILQAVALGAQERWQAALSPLTAALAAPGRTGRLPAALAG